MEHNLLRDGLLLVFLEEEGEVEEEGEDSSIASCLRGGRSLLVVDDVSVCVCFSGCCCW